MKFDDFVNALQVAGWRPFCDAQHTEIKKLWRKLWPVIAELEDELEWYNEQMNEVKNDD